MRFSERTRWEDANHPWTQVVQEARAAGKIVADLTSSNPTLCGLGFGSEEVLAPLAVGEALVYVPDALGMRPAREAVATYYEEHGAAIPIEQLCLTTSTSEAYSFLFRLLCDPGDEVLIANPSYPLFDQLAQLEGVELKMFTLLHDPGALPGAEDSWLIDLHSLQAHITGRTRAIVLVHPNNPTGNYVSDCDRVALKQLCVRHGLALIVDEVFLDYALEARGSATRSFAVADAAMSGAHQECLCFVLSGLSKVCALPQMKLSWIAVLGPAMEVGAAMGRLEVVADTFLSLNAPIQHASPHWLGAREEMQARIRGRLQEDLDYLDRKLVGSHATRLSVGGGWTVVLRVPATVQGEEFAVAAACGGVAVQPGQLYGLPAGRCVLSLLTPPEVWRRGLELLPIW